MFAVTWLVALSIWRFGHIEQRWDNAALRAQAASAADLDDLTSEVSAMTP
jgi:hypothetical protein